MSDTYDTGKVMAGMDKWHEEIVESIRGDEVRESTYRPVTGKPALSPAQDELRRNKAPDDPLFSIATN